MNKLLMFMLILGLSSCATYEQNRAVSTGTMIGGAAGAVLGAESGRVLEGAAVGAAIGAVTGAIISDSQQAAQVKDPDHHKAAVILVPHSHHAYGKHQYGKQAYRNHEKHERHKETHKRVQKEYKKHEKWQDRREKSREGRVNTRKEWADESDDD